MRSLELELAALVLGAAFATGCGSKPQTAEWCATNDECDPGFYCDPQTGLCDQDCVVDGDCGGDLICDAHGQCVEEVDTETEDADTDPCGDAVLLVVDRSTSMAADGKWTVLEETVATVLGMFADEIDFGLEVFPDDSCYDAYDDEGGTDLDKLCRGPDNLMVDIAAGTASSISDSLDTVGTCGGTPTGPALEKAAVEVEAHGGDVQIVLITDGLPNCNTQIPPDECECLLDEPELCEGSPENCLDLDAALAAAEMALEAGGTVHVLAFDLDDAALAPLHDIASAGGTGEAVHCPDQGGLGYALSEILNGVSDC